MIDQDDVFEALSNVIDPELGLDFVELGLVYGVEINDSTVNITFTLTTPACPIGPQVSEQMQEFVGELPGVTEVIPNMVFTPAWTPDKMSEDAKFALGYQASLPAALHRGSSAACRDPGSTPARCLMTPRSDRRSRRPTAGQLQRVERWSRTTRGPGLVGVDRSAARRSTEARRRSTAAARLVDGEPLRRSNVRHQFAKLAAAG